MPSLDSDFLRTNHLSAAIVTSFVPNVEGHSYILVPLSIVKPSVFHVLILRLAKESSKIMLEHRRRCSACRAMMANGIAKGKMHGVCYSLRNDLGFRMNQSLSKLPDRKITIGPEIKSQPVH